MRTPALTQRTVRALHTASTITVYEAHSPETGLPAVRQGRCPAGWKPDRMTWIKPPLPDDVPRAPAHVQWDPAPRTRSPWFELCPPTGPPQPEVPARSVVRAFELMMRNLFPRRPPP
ncbi:DUF4291 family protein [Streptomyces mirabilis]|uniref:DUF4291 family protein n=1 Tax=Streptomyces mirabilis TaxID=68239 RepID=UPI00367A4958